MKKYIHICKCLIRFYKYIYHRFLTSFLHGKNRFSFRYIKFNPKFCKLVKLTRELVTWLETRLILVSAN